MIIKISTSPDYRNLIVLVEISILLTSAAHQIVLQYVIMAKHF